MDGQARTREELQKELAAAQRKAAELEARVQAAQQFQLAFEALEEPVAILDPEMRVVRANQAMIEAFPGETVLGARCHELFHLADQPIPHLTCPGVQAFKTGQAARVEIRDPRLGERWLEVYAHPIRDPEGRVSHVVHEVRDITARKQAEEALKESEARFRHLFEKAPLGYQSLDEEGRLIEVNQAWLDNLGYQREEVIGRAFREFLAPEDVASFQGAFARYKAAGEISRAEFELVRKDGSRLFAEYHGRIGYDQEGRFKQTHCVFQDITARKQAEEQLRLIFSAVHQSTVGLAASDLEGNLLFVNQAFAALHGYTPEELLGRHLSVFHTPEQMPAVEAANRQIQETGEFSGEIWHARRDGTVFPALMQNSLLRDEQGRPMGMIGTLRDITEQKKLQARIQEAQKLESLGLVAGGVAHQFNNLLSGILGYAELASMDLPPDSPLQQSIGQIRALGERAAKLTRQMLAYAGTGLLDLQPLDLSAVVQDLIPLLEASVSKRARLEFNLAPDLPPIKADAAQVSPVVLNLVANASEALGHQKGRITVSTAAVYCETADLRATYLYEGQPEGTYVYLEVTDTGAGMAADIQNKVFDPFFTTRFPGRGLGLATVLGIVRAHQGAIKVETRPGEGSTFRVLFPASQAGASRSETPVKPPGKVKLDKIVLVVDDEEQVRNVVRLMLERAGLKVLTAGSGREGLELFHRHAQEIDAVLLDLTMPDLLGEEVFQEMKDIASHVPILLTSGYGPEEVVPRFRGLPLTGFLQKPYQSEMLLDKLREVLQG